MTVINSRVPGSDDASRMKILQSLIKFPMGSRVADRWERYRWNIFQTDTDGLGIFTRECQIWPARNSKGRRRCSQEGDDNRLVEFHR